MVTQELIAYVRAELGKGKTRAELQKQLFLIGGWQASDVDEVFRAIDGTAMPQRKVVSKHSGWKLFAVIVFVFGIGYCGWWIRDREMFFNFSIPLPGITKQAPSSNVTQNVSSVIYTDSEVSGTTPFDGVQNPPAGQTTTINSPATPDYQPIVMAQSDWASLSDKDIATLLAQYPTIPFALGAKITFSGTIDLIGEGTFEGIFTGTGSNNDFTILLRKNDADQTVSILKQKNESDGSTSPVVLTRLSETTMSTDFGLLPKEHGFYTISKTYNKTTKKFVCDKNGVAVYQWNPTTNLFEQNQLLTATYMTKLCK